jgi:hypothetical protein
MLSWLFKKKEPAAPALVDRIWLDRASAERAIVRAAQSGPLLVLAYFDQTQERVRQALQAAGLAEGPRLKVERADQLSSVPPGAAIIVAERHPVAGFNAALAQRLASLSPLTAPLCFTGLDDALMLSFGDGRLAQTMKQLGLSADEPLEHPMISKALANASRALEKRIGPAMSRLAPASSMAEWLQKNVPPA